LNVSLAKVVARSLLVALPSKMQMMLRSGCLIASVALCPRKNSRLLLNQAAASFSSCFAPDENDAGLHSTSFYPTVGSALQAVAINDKGGHKFPDGRP
jgi:hypothetical protein